MYICTYVRTYICMYLRYINTILMCMYHKTSGFTSCMHVCIVHYVFFVDVEVAVLLHCHLCLVKHQVVVVKPLEGDLNEDDVVVNKNLHLPISEE